MENNTRHPCLGDRGDALEHTEPVKPLTGKGGGARNKEGGGDAASFTVHSHRGHLTNPKAGTPLGAKHLQPPTYPGQRVFCQVL